MKHQPAVMAVIELHGDAGQPVPPEQFHARATELMDELMKLEECNADIADPTVSSDAGAPVMTVELLVLTDDQLEAAYKALTILRTALHAAGAKTDGWPIIHIENHTERVPDLVDA